MLPEKINNMSVSTELYMQHHLVCEEDIEGRLWKQLKFWWL